MKISITDFESLSLLYQVIGDSSTSLTEEEIVVDFSDAQILAPEVVLASAALTMRGIRNGLKIAYLPPRRPTAKSYLGNVCWEDFIRDNYQQPQELSAIADFYALPLWRVSSTHLEGYLLQAASFFHQVAKGKDWSGFETTVRELLNNVYDHSATPTEALIFIRYLPGESRLELAVSDLGVGLASKVMAYETSVQSASQAIEWAFSRGTSTHSIPSNRGFGLDIVRSFIAFVEGELTCYTSALKTEVGAKLFLHSPTSSNIFGTLFVLSFDPERLDDENRELTFDWD